MTSNGILRVRDRQPREDPHSIRQGRGSHPVPLSCKQSFRMMSQNDLGFFFSCGIGSGGIAARDGLFWIWVCPGLASFGGFSQPLLSKKSEKNLPLLNWKTLALFQEELPTDL